MSGKYIENPAWVGQLMRTEKPKLVLYAFAEAYVKTASRNVPVHTGATQEDFDSNKILKKSSHGFPLMEVNFRGNDYPHIWHIIEYGSVNNPAYAPLRKGAEGVGLSWQGA